MRLDQVIPAELWLETAKGNMPGYSSVNVFGYDPAMGTGGGDLWDFGGTYTFSATANITTISSSSAADTQTIKIVGLDANWNIATQNIVLTGQTKATLSTPLIRVFDAMNMGSTDIAGVVYIYVDGDITSGVPDTDSSVRLIINGAGGFNESMLGMYTIPNGYKGYLLGARVALANKTAAEATMARAIRTYGGTFRINSINSLNSTGTSSFTTQAIFPNAIPAKTDIKLLVMETSAIVAVSGGLSILLVQDGVL